MGNIILLFIHHLEETNLRFLKRIWNSASPLTLFCCNFLSYLTSSSPLILTLWQLLLSSGEFSNIYYFGYLSLLTYFYLIFILMLRNMNLKHINKKLSLKYRVVYRITDECLYVCVFVISYYIFKKQLLN